MSESPILDPEAVETLRSINPDDGGTLVRELVNFFLTDTPKRLAAMESAFEQNSAIELGRLAHFIKGSASNFGAHRLVALCFDIEQLSKSNSLESARGKFAELQNEYQRTRLALEALRAGN